MSQTNTTDTAPASLEAEPELDEQSLRAIQLLMSLLDKTFRTARTYGGSNQLSLKFIQQLYDQLTILLQHQGALVFVVQRFEFYYRGKVVYQKPSPNENLAFKLYAEGIRELTFSPGISLADVHSFLESLGADLESSASDDDDIVTRLWDKGISSVSIVTAEQILKTSLSYDPLAPQDAGALNSPLSHLKEISATELGKPERDPLSVDITSRDTQTDLLTGRTQDQETEATGQSPEQSGLGGDRSAVETDQTSASGQVEAADGKSSEGSGATDSGATNESSADASREGQGGASDGLRLDLPAYQVTQQERNQLALQIKAETLRDNSAYLLDMMCAMLASEKSAALLSELLDVFDETLKTLITAGNLKLLNSVVGVLRQTKRGAHLTEEHHEQIAALLDSLAKPDHISAIATYLNENTQVSAHDLQTFLQNFRVSAVKPLCSFLGKLKHKHHRLTVCDVLTTLAKDTPEVLTGELSDPRWYYVRNLLFIIGKLGNPRLASDVIPLTSHEDKKVRLEALRTLEILRPSGNGDHLVVLLNDPDELVRLSAMNLLRSGEYSTPFSVWDRLVSSKGFLGRPTTEIRSVFRIMCQTVGEDAVPYLQHLIMQRLWPKRKKKLEVGALAAETLAEFAKPSAITALLAGQKRLNRVIRNACKASLEAAMAKQRAKHKENPS